MQKKYKDVTFIGVNVTEKNHKDVIDFAKAIGEKMDYPLALDDTSEAYPQGVMYETWMLAAGQSTVPVAYIVDAKGKIAWIGHPMQMDDALDKIVTGKWDLAAASQAYEQQMPESGKLLRTFTVAKKTGDFKDLLKHVEKTIADDPEQEAKFGYMKFHALANQASSADQAVKYGKHLMDSVLHDSAEGFQTLAKSVVDSSNTKIKPNADLIKLALQAAVRADELAKGEVVAIAVTLARAYFASGDTAKAVEVQQRAVTMDEEASDEPDPALKKRLNEYKQAAGEK